MTVAAFPRYQIHDIPEALRQLANKIEHGDILAERCVVILEDGQSIDYKAFGAEPFTNAHAVGLCVAAMKEILE